jgi:hypothetical protein
MLMTRQSDFANLQAGQTVSIVAGEDDQRTEVPARVASSDQGVVALYLGITPIQSDQFATGTHVRLLMPDGHIEPAEVVMFEPGPEPLVVLEKPELTSPSESLRAFHRVPMHLVEALVTHVSSTGAARFRVRIVDLSGGGARILCPRPVSPGDPISLRLPLLEGRANMDVRGRVVWVRLLYKSWQAGVEFTGLSDPQRDVIVRSVFQEEVRWRRTY